MSISRSVEYLIGCDECNEGDNNDGYRSRECAAAAARRRGYREINGRLVCPACLRMMAFEELVEACEQVLREANLAIDADNPDSERPEISLDTVRRIADATRKAKFELCKQ